MKLIELVSFFKNEGSFEKFCQNKSLNIDSEVIGIYMEKPFDIDNNLVFFEIEKTEGKMEYFSNGINYFNLFDFYYFLDVIEESNNENKSLTNAEIARVLLSYAINNA